MTADAFDLPCSRVAEACRALVGDKQRITLRNVATRMGIAHSTLSRSAERKAQVARWQTLMEVADGVNASRRSLIERDSLAIAKLKLRLKKSEDDTALLVASHRAMIIAVGELGGMRAWQRFFALYSSGTERLTDLGALPETDDGVASR